MKVTDLKENECIHCETEEQAKAICKLMHEAGLEWNSGYNYLSKNNYGIYKSETCYYPAKGQYCYLKYYKKNGYIIYKAEQFLNQNTKTMSTVVNINPYTSEINITPKEGFEIDLEKSDLKNGKVVLKEVKEKYPTEFKTKIENTHHGIGVSLKYGNKLQILNVLLCLRDEYNRIDGFEEGFRFREDNWCITNYNNQFYLSKWESSSKIMHFVKEETAKLFLKNFEEQLEQIKEFL